MAPFITARYGDMIDGHQRTFAHNWWEHEASSISLHDSIWSVERTVEKHFDINMIFTIQSKSWKLAELRA